MRQALIFLFVITPMVVNAQTREEMVRDDRTKVESDGYWIYNDLPRAFDEARETNKPIIVVLRCIPCHECVKLDDDLVDTDPVIRPLLDQFVRLRQVSTNGLDLNLFQYDTDQSFAIFLLNADGTVYGRFGTRSHRTEWYGDVSLEGLAKALRTALQWHKEYPANKQFLDGKRGSPMEVSSPEKFPSLKDKYTDRLNYEGEVVKSCIHCHQIGDAQRSWYRDSGKPIPDKVLFPYPHPKVVGLTLDPNELATIKSVREDSPAGRAGFRAGDRLERFDGQRLLSIADVQWVLHNVSPDGGKIPAIVQREKEQLTLNLKLSSGWRQDGDISWRVTTWGLRRMGTGGMVLEPATNEQRVGSEIPPAGMALFVKRVAKYGPHGAARRSGFREGDVIVRFDGRDDLASETALLRHTVQSRSAGDVVDVTVVRDRKRRELKLPMQP